MVDTERHETHDGRWKHPGSDRTSDERFADSLGTSRPPYNEPPDVIRRGSVNGEQQCADDLTSVDGDQGGVPECSALRRSESAPTAGSECFRVGERRRCVRIRAMPFDSLSGWRTRG
jgi:hypothetical protein